MLKSIENSLFFRPTSLRRRMRPECVGSGSISTTQRARFTRLPIIIGTGCGNPIIAVNLFLLAYKMEFKESVQRKLVLGKIKKPASKDGFSKIAEITLR